MQCHRRLPGGNHGRAFAPRCQISAVPFLPCLGGTLQPSRGGPRAPERPEPRRAEPGATTPACQQEEEAAGRVGLGCADRSCPGPGAAPAGAPLAQVGGQDRCRLRSRARPGGGRRGAEGRCGDAARGFEISDSRLE